MPEQTPDDRTPNEPVPNEPVPNEPVENEPVANERAPVDQPVTSRGSRLWLIPAVTFLVGVLLGAVVVGVSRSGDGGDVAQGSTPSGTQTTAAPTVSTTTASRPAATVTVPGSCLQVADNTQQLLDLVQKAAGAARDLDASQLSSIVRQLQEAQAGLQAQANACQSAAASVQGQTG